ncbi:MAG: hypothetical protein V1493_06525 [Candidatus Diapherotrites archaeon]
MADDVAVATSTGMPIILPILIIVAIVAVAIVYWKTKSIKRTVGTIELILGAPAVAIVLLETLQPGPFDDFKLKLALCLLGLAVLIGGLAKLIEK